MPRPRPARPRPPALRAALSALSALAVVFLTLPAAACGDGAGPDDLESQFMAVVEGGDLASLGGLAVHRVEAVPGTAGAERGFTIRLIDDEVSGELRLQRRVTDRPGVGSHVIVPLEDLESPADFRGDLRYVAGGVLQQLEVRSGIVRVTASRGEQIEGTLEMRARREGDGQQVYLTATFVSRPYDEVVAGL